MTVQKSFIIIFIGLILVALAFIISGSRLFFYEGFQFGISGDPEFLSFLNSDSSEASRMESFKKRFQDIRSFSFEASKNIAQLDIRTGVSQLLVYTSNESSLSVLTAGEQKDKIDVKVEGDTLHIIEEDTQVKSFWSVFRFLKRKKQSLVLIGIPKGESLKSLSIIGGIGESHIENIRTDFLNVEVGIGESQFKNLRANKARIKSGIGESRLYDCELNNTTIKVGIGEFLFEGNLYGETHIESGIGETTLRIKAPESDYNIRGKSGIGEVNIQNNSSEFPLGSSLKHTGKNAKHTISIEGGIGEVNVEFIK